MRLSVGVSFEKNVSEDETSFVPIKDEKDEEGGGAVITMKR